MGLRCNVHWSGHGLVQRCGAEGAAYCLAIGLWRDVLHEELVWLCCAFGRGVRALS